MIGILEEGVLEVSMTDCMHGLLEDY